MTAEMEDFTMPHIQGGTTVLWYPFGIRDGNKPQVAIVTRVSGRNVNLFQMISGANIQHSRHIDDPKLTLNADQRESGGWDYTDEFKDQVLWREEVARRLAAANSPMFPDKDADELVIEKKPVAKSVPKGREILDDYVVLRRKAIEAGVIVRGNPKKKWLLTQLAILEEDAGPPSPS